MDEDGLEATQIGIIGFIGTKILSMEASRSNVIEAAGGAALPRTLTEKIGIHLTEEKRRSNTEKKNEN